LNYIIFYKPYEVLSQFTDEEGRQTLKDFIFLPGVYAAGRLDYRSEGLLLLSDDGPFIHRLTDPRFEHPKTYLAQVEGSVHPEALGPIRAGVDLGDLQAKPAQVEIIPPPDLPERSKPVRPYHPTTWLKIVLHEGKKHQVRRMTAATGFPTLRLVRVAIGRLALGDLKPGEWRKLSSLEIRLAKTMGGEQLPDKRATR
jgi:23S rRNA pseudouridine2457 synthase